MNDPAAQSNPFPTHEDPAALLQQLDLQIALQRAKRLSGQGSNRRTARMMGVLFILFIFMGAIGALLYLKSSRYPGVIRPRATPTPESSALPAR